MIVWLELELARVKHWDRERTRDANSNLLVELETFELGGFQYGFESGFGLIPLSPLLANSWQFLPFGKS